MVDKSDIPLHQEKYKVLSIKKKGKKIMKKFLITLAAVFSLTTGVFAAPTEKVRMNMVPNYDKFCEYLQLDRAQEEAAYPVMQQMYNQLHLIYDVIDNRRMAFANYFKSVDANRVNMKRILNDDQFQKYETLLKATLFNYEANHTK